MADLIFTDVNDNSHVGSLTQLDYKFRVHFRRTENYMGEFGFDWLQDEFLSCTTLDKLEKEYNPCEILNQKYLIPWMSIKKGQQMRVNLVIEEFDGVSSDLDVIKLKPQKGINFIPSEIKIKDIIGKKVKHFPSGEDVGIEIAIECVDDIDKDTKVEVYDKNDEVIGKLSFLKNNKEYKLPIRVVLLVRKGFELNDEMNIEAHLTNNADSDFDGCADLAECMQKLENQMNYYAYNQAFVKCEIERDVSNKIKIYHVPIDTVEWTNLGLIQSLPTGSIINKNSSDLLPQLLKDYKQQVERGQNGTGFFKGSVIFITGYESYEDTTDSSTGITTRDTLLGLGSLNIIDDRHCILFKSHPQQPRGNIKTSTYIHELGHVLSLTHPFQIFDKEIIQKNEKFVVDVDNVMNNPNVSQKKKEELWTQHKNTYRFVTKSSYLYYRNKYSFTGSGTTVKPEEGATKCMIMDYIPNLNRRVFTQWQWRVIQESVQRYFSPQNN